MISQTNRIIMYPKVVSAPFADFILLKESLIQIKFTRSGQLELEEAKEILRITTQLAGSAPHALIYDFNKLSVQFNQEVRALAQNRDTISDNLFARAFVTYNLSNKLEVNHFIKYNKPTTPTTIFSSFDQALRWIEEHQRHIAAS